jgi:hypothetical protein
METVFKVGQNVYDYAYGKGNVVEVQNSRYLDNIMLVKFDNRDIPVRYSLDGRLINFRSCGGQLDPENVANNPTLSTSPYTFKGFEQKPFAPTFEEVWEEVKGVYEAQNKYRDEKYGGYPSQELADAAEALRKLLFLRDYYNEGWKPDWENGKTEKYCIVVHRGCLSLTNYDTLSSVMSFKSVEIRDKFLEEQRELLEIAKPLL